MVLPFRRKGSDEDEDEVVDQDIEDIMNEAEGVQDESGITLPESIPRTKRRTSASRKNGTEARTVIDTCMDVRRGENILIVCDPTTTEIGQAIHDGQFEVRSCALGGHAQRSPSWR